MGRDQWPQKNAVAGDVPPDKIIPAASLHKGAFKVMGLSVQLKETSLVQPQMELSLILLNCACFFAFGSCFFCQWFSTQNYKINKTCLVFAFKDS